MLPSRKNKRLPCAFLFFLIFIRVCKDYFCIFPMYIFSFPGHAFDMKLVPVSTTMLLRPTQYGTHHKLATAPGMSICRHGPCGTKHAYLVSIYSPCSPFHHHHHSHYDAAIYTIRSLLSHLTSFVVISINITSHSLIVKKDESPKKLTLIRE